MPGCTVQRAHQRIAMYLCHHRSSGNGNDTNRHRSASSARRGGRYALRRSADDRAQCRAPALPAAWPCARPGRCSPGRSSRIHFGHRDCNRRLADAAVKPLTVLAQQLFRIFEPSLRQRVNRSGRITAAATTGPNSAPGPPRPHPRSRGIHHAAAPVPEHRCTPS